MSPSIDRIQFPVASDGCAMKEDHVMTAEVHLSPKPPSRARARLGIGLLLVALLLPGCAFGPESLVHVQAIAALVVRLAEGADQEASGSTRSA